MLEKPVPEFVRVSGLLENGQVWLSDAVGGVFYRTYAGALGSNV